METKTGKLKEMRVENQNLQLTLDEIPKKDTEIQKLQHRLQDLKLELNQQREIHKLVIKFKDNLLFIFTLMR